MNRVSVHFLELFKSRCSGTKITRLSWISGLIGVIPQIIPSREIFTNPPTTTPPTMPSAKDFDIDDVIDVQMSEKQTATTLNVFLPRNDAECFEVLSDELMPPPETTGPNIPKKKRKQDHMDIIPLSNFTHKQF